MKKWGIRSLAIAVGTLLLPMLAAPISALASPSTGLDRGQFVDPHVREPISTAIATTNEVLGSPVYVLDNRLVVAELPPERLAPLSGGAPHIDRSDGLTARFTVLPYRLIVVDDEDNIISVSSNTTGDDYTFYALRIREGHVDGQEHPLTDETLSQYNRLLGEVDWTQTGRVYERNLT